MKISTINRTNKNINEDIVGYTSKSFWVIDGATGCYDNIIKNYPSDANWYVHVINGYLKEHIDNKNHSILKVLKNAVEFAKREYLNLVGQSFPVNSDAFPSATIALARIQDDKVETYILGDCSIVVKCISSTYVLEDGRVREFEEQLIKKIAAYQQENSCSIQLARKHFSNEFKNNRSKKNKEDGYFVLEFSDAAIDQGKRNAFSIQDVKNILLMSDGFFRIVDVFQFYRSGANLLQAAKNDGINEIWNKIDNFERNDPDCIEYPRTKKSDDSSAMLVDFDT